MGELDNLSQVYYNVATWDGMLMFLIIALMSIVTYPGQMTFENLRNQTSEVIKFKQRQKERAKNQKKKSKTEGEECQ